MVVNATVTNVVKHRNNRRDNTLCGFYVTYTIGTSTNTGTTNTGIPCDATKEQIVNNYANEIGYCFTYNGNQYGSSCATPTVTEPLNPVNNPCTTLKAVAVQKVLDYFAGTGSKADAIAAVNAYNDCLMANNPENSGTSMLIWIIIIVMVIAIGYYLFLK